MSSSRRALLMYAADYFQGGLWRYAYNLGKNLIELDKSHSYTFVHGQKKDENFLSLNKYEEISPQTMCGKIFKLPQKLADEGFDVVHQTENFCPFFSSKQKYKKIVTIHDITPLKYPRYFSKGNWWYYKYVLPQLLRRVDTIICPSIATKNDLVTFYNIRESKIIVIYEGVEEKFFQPIPLEIKQKVLQKFGLKDKTFVLTLGVNLHRNLTTIFQAFKQLPKNVLDHTSLVVAGATGREYAKKPKFIGRATQYLEKEVKLLGLEGKVLFTGHINDEELRSLYQTAQIFCFASLSEGFGFPPLEACASRCLVISSNQTAMAETLQSSAILLDPINAGLWTECLEAALVNFPSFQSRIDKAYMQVKDFTWEKCAKEHLRVYNQ